MPVVTGVKNSDLGGGRLGGVFCPVESAPLLTRAEEHRRSEAIIPKLTRIDAIGASLDLKAAKLSQ